MNILLKINDKVFDLDDEAALNIYMVLGRALGIESGFIDAIDYVKKNGGAVCVGTPVYTFRDGK